MDLLRLEDEFGEFALELRRADDVVVYPVIVAAAGLLEDDAVIFEAVLGEPFLRYLAMRFGARCEERDDVAFVMPVVHDSARIGENGGRLHALRLFVRNIFADRPIDVDEIVLDALGQDGAVLFLVRAY